jgi:hypothetical protein
MRLHALGASLAALPLAAMAETGNAPPPDFFAGQYRMIGTDATGALVDLMLRLDPSPRGLDASTCETADAGYLALPGPDGDHYLEGGIAGHALVCDHFISYENYPMITCFGDGDTRLTLWVADIGFDAPLSCGD